ncbi:hypothetical protein SLNSH_23500 [Alsobacter soli]|uniref:Fimbrial biogenesis outer membrane usher protein n=1 Tax=Alsobacter soli TaxID=2109933 RepID=A0A2T1HLS4_9HYPH|nr:fimbria/pilus outer membrane usher protein [Alsobacter soli]PSC02541.1 hypothetical protein SLNSH_23500 [Alsobacter soli]
MCASTRTARLWVVFLIIVWPLFESRASLAGPEERDLHLEVLINDRQGGLIGAFHQSADGRMTATRAELKSLGLAPGAGADNEPVDLASMPGVTAVFDEPTQRMMITVTDLDRLAPTAVDAAAENGEPAREPPVSNVGLALNYLVYGSAQQSVWREAPKFSGGSVHFDARAFSPYGVLEQSAILGATTMRQADAIRLDTRFTYTDSERLISAQVGDVMTAGPSWARPIRMGGAAVSRDYTLRSDIVTAALPVLNGTAAAPSTVDVFVNGVKTYSKDVPAGPYSLMNVPGLSGAGRAQIVLRDATGREIKSSLPFFTSAALLKDGAFEYSGAVGFARYGFATAGTSYGMSPVGSLAARYGLTDSVTVETYNEGGAGLANIGIGASASVFGFGVLSVAGRASRLGQAVGYQGHASFETRIGPFSVNGAAQYSFGDFRDLVDATNRLFRPGKVRSFEIFSALDPAFGSVTPSTPLREMERLSISTEGPWVGSSVGLSAVRQVYQGRPESRLLTAQFSQRFWDGWSLFATSYVDVGKSRDFGFLAGLNVILGPTDSISSGVSAAGKTVSGVMQAQRQMGTETGSYGARVSVAQSRGQSRGYGAGASYQSSIGRIAVNGDHQNGSSNVNGEFEGAIVAMPDGIAATRRVEDSFALVKTGVPDVEVSHEGRKVGRTDRWGRVVVPSLFSNSPNRISVNPDTLPTTASLTKTEDMVTPAKRSGVVVRFETKSEAESATVILKDKDGKFLDAGLPGVVEGSQEPFVVGTEGRAYMRSLSTDNVAVVDLGGQSCRASFSFTPQPDRVVEIGPVTCQ